MFVNFQDAKKIPVMMSRKMTENPVSRRICCFVIFGLAFFPKTTQDWTLQNNYYGIYCTNCSLKRACSSCCAVGLCVRKFVEQTTPKMHCKKKPISAEILFVWLSAQSSELYVFEHMCMGEWGVTFINSTCCSSRLCY